MRAAAQVATLGADLESLGLAVSTGPVVELGFGGARQPA